MKRRTMTSIFIIAAATIFLCSQAWATPILLGQASHKTLGNAGEDTVLKWLENEIIAYNKNHEPDLPFDAVHTEFDYKVEKSNPSLAPNPSFGAKSTDITLPTDYNNYLVLHWGGPEGGIFQAYYLAPGPESSYTFAAPGKYGLSSYSFYGTSTPVPEPAGLLLLGTGLVGIAAFRRQLKK